MRQLLSRPIYWLLVRFLPVVIVSCLNVSAADAAGAPLPTSIDITIQQTNPAGAVQKITCVAHEKCITPVVIQTLQGKQETLNVNLEFVPNNLLAEFKGANGYYYATSKGATTGDYEAIWHTAPPGDKASVSDVTLFLPAVPNIEAPILHVTAEAAKNITHAPVADLEITTQPVP
jgi:hypothetical protein